jgi:aldehyde dehydrogenase (NAD+)
MLNQTQFYINGAWVNPSHANNFDVINPADESVCATISLGSETDTNLAVSAAKNALTTWSVSSIEQRIEVLEALYSIYKRRWSDMAEAISLEMGAPIDFANTAQTGAGAGHIKTFIEKLRAFEFEKPLGDHAPDNRIVFEPKGVCALITPWNWPINQVTLKVIPAIATGCTMVLKPSEIAPLSSMVFAEMIDEAGLPPGVFNLVNGDGPGVGSQLSGHPDVAMVSFTGSTRAGALISHNAADDFKRIGLELGGKGANIIFSDADDDAIIRGVKHCFSNTGQSCNAPTRMLVERSIYEQSVAKAQAVAAQTLVDLPAKKGKHIGPVVSQLQFDKIQDLIQQGIDEKATLSAGGTGKPEGFETGYFVKPTIFSDVNNQMTIAQTEIFGPVLSMIPFEDEEEAIAITNDTCFGLTNYIQTQDADKAKRVAKRLRSGMVEINGANLSMDAPFGGYKHSGIGREGGVLGLEEFLEVKVISGWK